MVSKIGRSFLSDLHFTNLNVEQVAKRYAYSERMTIALDLQFITKALLAEVEEYTGEKLTDVLFEVQKH